MAYISRFKSLLIKSYKHDLGKEEMNFLSQLLKVIVALIIISSPIVFYSSWRLKNIPQDVATTLPLTKEIYFALLFTNLLLIATQAILFFLCSILIRIARKLADLDRDSKKTQK